MLPLSHQVYCGARTCRQRGSQIGVEACPGLELTSATLGNEVCLELSVYLGVRRKSFRLPQAQLKLQRAGDVSFSSEVSLKMTLRIKNTGDAPRPQERLKKQPVLLRRRALSLSLSLSLSLASLSLSLSASKASEGRLSLPGVVAHLLPGARSSEGGALQRRKEGKARKDSSPLLRFFASELR